MRHSVFVKSYMKTISQIKLIQHEGFEEGILEFEVRYVPENVNFCIKSCMMDEVPSCTVDRVWLVKNDGEMNDQMFEETLLQVPIDVSIKHLQIFNHHHEINLTNLHQLDDTTTLLFDINVQNVNIDNNQDGPYNNDSRHIKTIYLKSNDFVWHEIGNQKELFDDVRPIQDILLNVLTPKSAVHATVAAIVKSGKYNCKFNPCSYLKVKKQRTLTIIEPLTTEEQELISKGMGKVGKMFLFQLLTKEPVYVNDKNLRKFNLVMSKNDAVRKKYRMQSNDNSLMWQIESVRPINQPATSIFLHAVNILIYQTTYYSNNITSEYRIPINIKNDRKFYQETLVRMREYSKLKVFQMTLDDENNDILIILSGKSSALSLALVDIINAVFGKKLSCSFNNQHQYIEIFNNELINNYTDLDVLVESFRILNLILKRTRDLFTAMLKEVS